MLTDASETPLHGVRQIFITLYFSVFRVAEVHFFTALAAVSVARTARNAR